MRKLIAPICATVLLAALPASAQVAVKIFDPIAITASQPFPSTATFEDAVPVAEKQLYLACDPGATATITGPYAGNGLIVDNFIQVQNPADATADYCPNVATKGCFAGVSTDPMGALGFAAETAYLPVGPQDVSGSLVTGLGLYTFRLMDWGYTYAASQLTLNTTCAVKDQVCHRDNGKPGGKTLIVGAAAIPAHLAHGDTLGACK